MDEADKDVRPRLSGIAQVSMRALDLERSINFYRDVLGLELLSQHDNMAFMLAGSIRIMLTVPEAPEFDHPGSILYFDTQDIEADCRKLAALGAQIRRPPFVAHSEGSHAFWLAFFCDSEGNTLGLSQWQRDLG